MTALAMIIGMVPMALGLGEAGEQNAPLGRAVIGGLAGRDLRDACSWFRSSTPCCAASRPVCTRSISALPPKQPAHRLEVSHMASSQDARSPKFYVLGVGAIIGAGGGGVLLPLLPQSGDRGGARSARPAVADRGPRIEVVTATAGPTKRTIKLLGDVRSGCRHDALLQSAGYLKNDRRSTRATRSRPGRSSPRSNCRSSISNTPAPSADLAQQAAQPRRGSRTLREGQHDAGRDAAGGDRRAGGREQRRRRWRP